jgi:hypothetical protein
MSPSEKLIAYRNRAQVTEDDVRAIIEAHFEQDPEVTSHILVQEVRNAFGWGLREALYFVQVTVRDSTNSAIPASRKESILAIGKTAMSRKL